MRKNRTFSQGLQLSFSSIQTRFEKVQEHVHQRLREAALGLVMELYLDEVEELCGKPFSRKPEDGFYRRGSDPSSVLIQGQRMKVNKPRVHQEGEEAELQTHRALRDYDILNDRVLAHMLTGVSTRNYGGLLEELENGLGLKKSTVSKAFVKGSQEALDLLNGRDLHSFEWCAVFIDGIVIAERHVVVALGVTTRGHKMILGLREGDSEDSEVCKDLLQNLIERGLNKQTPFLFVLDGSKALKKAVRRVFGERFPIQRCIRHKERNVLKYLPQSYHGEFRRRWKLIHGMVKIEDALDEYRRLLFWISKISQDAEKSILEAEEETLTVIRFNCPAILRRTLLSTNSLESAFDGVRSKCRRVKNWKGMGQISRWTAASILDVEKNFLAIPGYREIPILIAEFKKDLLLNTEVA